MTPVAGGRYRTLGSCYSILGWGLIFFEPQNIEPQNVELRNAQAQERRSLNFVIHYSTFLCSAVQKSTPYQSLSFFYLPPL